MSQIELDLERQREAKAYSRIRHRLFLVNLLFGGIYTLAWLIIGWSQELRDFLITFTINEWFLVAGFGIIFGGIYYLLNLPLAYYESYVLPHRFNMSNQKISGWVKDQAIGLGIGILLAGLMLEIIYAVLRTAPQTWWLWSGLIILLFTVVLANLAPVLILPRFNKYTPLGEEHADLISKLMLLAKHAGTHIQGVYKFDMSRRTNAANAALTGIGNTRRIILGDTLLDEFNNDEIETVLAHELGHHVHRDIPKGIFIESLITLGGLYLASLVLDWGVQFFGFISPADVAGMPLFILIMGLYGLLLVPFTNAYSRRREYRADEYALKTTGNGDAYASALTRLANQNLADVDPEPWVVFLLHSHPPLAKRISMAADYSNQ